MINVGRDLCWHQLAVSSWLFPEWLRQCGGFGSLPALEAENCSLSMDPIQAGNTVRKAMETLVVRNKFLSSLKPNSRFSQRCLNYVFPREKSASETQRTLKQLCGISLQANMFIKNPCRVSTHWPHFLWILNSIPKQSLLNKTRIYEAGWMRRIKYWNANYEMNRNNK